MGTSANLSQIIRFYADKQKSAFIDFHEFCAYLKKYAEHHVEEQEELVKYLGDPAETVLAELEGLSQKRLAALISHDKKKIIVSISTFSIKYANRFKEILENESVPFPVISDLPKNFPLSSLEQKEAGTYIKEILEHQDSKAQTLNVILFSHDCPAMLLPSCVPAKVLMETAKMKIRRILSKDEFHDYYLKKLRSSNPGKELIIQHFFQNFVENKYQSDNIEDTLSSDDYYYWNQLCYFIRQDFEKIQDKTLEDINILQAIELTEINNIYLKQKMQNRQRRDDALKTLVTMLANPPYAYTMDQILKFKDNSGKLLYGQFSEEDLKKFIQVETGESAEGQLPRLLVFKVSSGSRYFIYKTKILPYTVRLCNEAANVIQKTLEDKWYKELLNYNRLPEMTNQKLFEDVLEEEVRTKSPVLYALLNANFFKLLSYEDGIDESMVGGRIFKGHDIAPYSDLLLLKNAPILAQAKMLLPFWYTMPIISWIASLFAGKKRKASSSADNVKTGKSIEEVLDGLEAEDEKQGSTKKKPRAKKDVLAELAEDISKDFVPEGSSIERELDFLCKQWNKMITKQANLTLTEDVNSLIRDYMRKVINTLSSTTFTADRVRGLAKTLVRTPNMQKIKEEEALTRYVELYILKLVSNK
ncbi:MAG: hypothetical protein HUK25_08770 [Treponema sp.]|nr:hypothetical protein [Treponema sp.]